MKRDVLHLIGSNLVGGPEKQILHHAADMRGSDYRMEIGSFHDLKERPEVLVAAEQRNIPTFCLPGGVRLDLVRLLAEKLHENPDMLLCTHGFKANVVGYLAARRTGARHAAFVRGFTAENKRVILYEILERQALRRAQRVVCVSQKQADEMERLRGGRRKPMVVKNAMLPPYERALEGAAITRRGLGVPDDAFVYGSVGRLSREKGHRFMVSAFHRLIERNGGADGLFLIVVGDGHEQPALEQQALELGIRERTHFAGYQGNCAPWMELMDCLVQPSLTEGTPNSVLEALCLRVPVIATAVGGVPDVIADGQNGLLVPAEDAERLAMAMDRMRTEDGLRAKLVEGSLARLEEFSPAHQRLKMIEMYEDAFQDAPGGLAR